MQAVHSLVEAEQLIRGLAPDIMLIDKSFGAQSVLQWLADLRAFQATTSIVVWGSSITEPEALRFLQSGVKGILRKTSSIEALAACLTTVSAGANWMEEALFRDSPHPQRYPRSELTSREHQVLELVEQGMKNKEIARELGIRPGTVKIHLKHIFEKTGVRGRYGLALTGLKERGVFAAPHA